MPKQRKAKLNPSIGKRVHWKCDDETGYGTLMAVNCDTSSIPHLVQRDDGEGWELKESDTYEWYVNARAQGVKTGTKDLWWVKSYKVVGSKDCKHQCKSCGKKLK